MSSTSPIIVVRASTGGVKTLYADKKLTAVAEKLNLQPQPELASKN